MLNSSSLMCQSSVKNTLFHKYAGLASIIAFMVDGWLLLHGLYCLGGNILMQKVCFAAIGCFLEFC